MYACIGISLEQQHGPACIAFWSKDMQAHEQQQDRQETKCVELEQKKIQKLKMSKKRTYYS